VAKDTWLDSAGPTKYTNITQIKLGIPTLFLFLLHNIKTTITQLIISYNTWFGQRTTWQSFEQGVNPE